MSLSTGDIKLLIDTVSPSLEYVIPSAGRKVDKGWEEISSKRRTINGTLVSDLVARKRTFSISYEYLTGEELEKFVDFY